MTAVSAVVLPTAAETLSELVACWQLRTDVSSERRRIAAQRACSPLENVQILVEELATFLCTAVAGQLVAGILDGELVVVGQLLAAVDAPRGKDDDVFLAVHGDDPRIAVGLTGVVDKAGGIAVHCGIHHLVVIDTKHVAADPLRGKMRQMLLLTKTLRVQLRKQNLK